METEKLEQTERSMVIRALAALGWLLAIYFVSNILLGAVVGGMAGADATSVEEGSMLGQTVATEFFASYGIVILLLQVTVFAALAFAGKLPGTTRLKQVKKS